MIDDHDRCEWVNISSGTGHPGCPRQNPDSRQTVAAAVVVKLKLCPCNTFFAKWRLPPDLSGT